MTPASLLSLFQTQAPRLPDSLAVHIVSVPAREGIDWLTWWTGLLGVGTIVLAAASWRSLHWLKEQGKDLKAQHETLKESVATLRDHSEHLAEQAKQLKASVSTSSMNTRRELRAYLSVKIGDASYQDSSQGIPFEARPLVANKGKTPAYNVRTRRIAEVVNFLPGLSAGELPYGSFPFQLPLTASGSGTLGADEHFLLIYAVNKGEDEGIVADVKAAKGRAFMTWGEITYEDIFGDQHWLKYSLYYTWNKSDRIFGYFTERHNDADRDTFST